MENAADDFAFSAAFSSRRDELLQRSSPSTLLVLASGIGLFSIWDFWLDAANATNSLIVRCITIAFVLLGYALVRRRPAASALRWIYGATYVIATAGITWAGCMLHGGLTYGVAGIIGIPTFFAFYPVERRVYLSTNLTAGVVVILIAWASGRALMPMANFVIFYLMFLWAGLVTNSMLRRQQLRAFQLERIARIEARTDSLTGLSNRRCAEEQLAKFVEGGMPAAGCIALVLVDIDHFKSINDRFGHQCGDEALCAVALLLRNCTTQPLHVSRWGGEEFLIVGSFADIAMPAQLAQQIVQLARLLSLPKLDHEKISVSVGVADLRQGDDLDRWLRRADLALYRAKEGGRNRIVVAN
jgi:diguanylate cyclase (GGDEF)-like protein